MENKEKVMKLLEEARNFLWYVGKEDFDKTYTIVEEILTIDENNIEGQKLKLVLLIALGKYKDALKYVNKLLEKQVNIYGLYDYKGKILMELKKYNKAREYFEIAYEKKEYNEDTDRNYAKVLMELREYSKALRHCEYAKRNEKNGYYSGVDEIKEEIHRRVINDMKINGVFGHKYLFENIESINYIVINKNSIEIVYGGFNILLDVTGDRIINRKVTFSFDELVENFKNATNSSFLEYGICKWVVDENGNEIKDIEFQVLPVLNLNIGDTIVSSYFISNYEWDYYTYEDGMYEVLMDGQCIGYVIKK